MKEKQINYLQEQLSYQDQLMEAERHRLYI